MNNSVELEKNDSITDEDCQCSEKNTLVSLPCKMSKKVCNCMKKISNLTFEDKMSMSIKISDKTKKDSPDEGVCFSKQLGGSTECNLLKALGIAALVLGGLGIFGIIWSGMRK